MSEFDFMPVLLWSDGLLAVLLLSLLALVFHVRAQPPLRAAWRKVGQSPAGMAAATVLLGFLLIGVLDSLHFRPALKSDPKAGRHYAVEVRSVLDVLLEDMRTKTEKTYSAPLATHLFAKENIERDGQTQREFPRLAHGIERDGQTQREFPRLAHGGRHLSDPERQWRDDITQRVGAGLLAGALVWVAAMVLITALEARALRVSVARAFVGIWRGDALLEWRAVLITLALLASIIGPIAFLAEGYHVFGTDKVGQDVLYLSLKSVRTALLIGTLTTLVMLPFALVLGIVAGYFGGRVDDLIQYLYTVLNSIPGVLLIAAAVLMLQVAIEQNASAFATAAERADVRLLALCGILGLTSWTGLCRLLRGETLKLRELEYVQAARAFGVSAPRIMWRHIGPNVMHIVLIAVVMDFSALVLAEAVLSYVGIGVDPNTVSFGSMINAARMELAREPMVWWSLGCAFVFMFVLVLAANLFSDAVRDALDPRVARRVRNHG